MIKIFPKDWQQNTFPRNSLQSPLRTSPLNLKRFQFNQFHRYTNLLSNTRQHTLSIISELLCMQIRINRNSFSFHSFRLCQTREEINERNAYLSSIIHFLSQHALLWEFKHDVWKFCFHPQFFFPPSLKYSCTVFRACRNAWQCSCKRLCTAKVMWRWRRRTLHPLGDGLVVMFSSVNFTSNSTLVKVTKVM